MSINIYGTSTKRYIDVHMKRLCHVAKAIEPNDVINLSVLEDKIKSVLNESWIKELGEKNVTKLPEKKLPVEPETVKKSEMTQAEKLDKKASLLKELKSLLKVNLDSAVAAKKKKIQDEIEKLSV